MIEKKTHEKIKQMEITKKGHNSILENQGRIVFLK